MNPVKNLSIRYLFLLTSFLGFLAVAIGAFGAHALKEIIGIERMPIFETGNKYHFYHTVVSLIVLLLLKKEERNDLLRLSYLFFTVGVVLFSFSLYALAITKVKILGIITPFGGVCFLLGWITLAMGTLQSRDVP